MNGQISDFIHSAACFHYENHDNTEMCCRGFL